MFVRRIAKHIPWPDRMLKIAYKWGRKIKKLVIKDSIKLLNRKGNKFDWDKDKLSNLEVKKDPLKIIHPDIPEELPGIEFERDHNTPSRVTVRSKPSVTKQAAAARISAGVDEPPEDSTVTRGVDDATATNGSDDADQGVEMDEYEDGDDDLPRLTTEDDNSDSNGNNKNEDDSTPADALNEDSVGDEETPVSSPV